MGGEQVIAISTFVSVVLRAKQREREREERVREWSTETKKSHAMAVD